MNQQNIQETPLRMLNVAMVLQILYTAFMFWIVMDPVFFLHAAGFEGTYDIPFDSVHLVAVMVSTILFAVMYTLLTVNIKKQKQMGLGFGITIGVMSYISYFTMTSVVAKLASVRIQLLGEDATAIAGWSMSFEENVAAYAIVAGWYEYARLLLKTAIVLLLLAYAIYCYRKREQNMPKRLY